VYHITPIELIIAPNQNRSPFIHREINLLPLKVWHLLKKTPKFEWKKPESYSNTGARTCKPSYKHETKLKEKEDICLKLTSNNSQE
jgi:hypothetical protein